MRSMLDRVPDRVLHTIDSWRFWMIVAFTALSVIVIWGVNLTQRSIKEQAAREARIQSDYRSCIRSIPSLRAISRHVSGVNDLADILVENSKVTISHSNPAELGFRRANLHRLMRAQRKIAAVKKFDVPSVRSCEQRRRALGG